MNPNSFENYRQQLLSQAEIFNKIDISKEEGYLAGFAFFSANLANFLPSIPVSEHEELHKKMLLNTAMETFDRNITHIVDFSVFEGQTQYILPPHKPFIYCSFHLGSYRIFINHLLRAGHKLVLLVRQGVFDEQLQDLIDFTNKLVSIFKVESEMLIVNADEPTSALKILRALRDGYSLVAYMDADSGSGEQKGEEISFLNHGIYARKGISFLSYASNIPIVPLVAYRKPDLQNVICVGEPIYPDKNLSKAAFEKQTLQQLYNWFAEYIVQVPEQWEVWGYINNFMLPPLVPPLVDDDTVFQKTTFQFNLQRCALFELASGPVLFDRLTYNVTEITPDFFLFLSQFTFSNPQIILESSVFQDLVRNQVII